MSDQTIDATELAVAVRPDAENAISATAESDIKPPVTAAQAKIQAIADLTHSAYQKAATLELTAEEREALQADFPDAAFQPGAAGKEHLIYIEHAHLRDRFNAVFGMGKWAIVPRNRWNEPFTTSKGTPGERVYVEAMLVVRGCFVGEAVGAMEYYPKNESQNYGDAVEGAKTAAFRRCAKEFGVGLQAWKKEFCDGWWARKRGGRDFSKKPAPPQAPKPAPSPAVPDEAEKARRSENLRILEKLAGKPFFPELVRYFQECPAPSGKILLAPFETLEDLPASVTAPLVRKWDDCLPKIELWLREHPKREEPKGKPPIDDEWWREIIVPVPRKGMKKAEYDKHPDTIGSLFDMRHGSDDEANAARQRLFGLVHNWDAKPREYNGKVYQPSAADIKCREALDAFWAWFEKNHPDQKL